MNWLIILTILLFDSDFRQTRTSSMLDAPVVQTGHMHYAAPDTIEWRYTGANAASLPPQILNYIRTMVATEQVNDGWMDVNPLPKSVKRLFSSISVRIQDGVAREVVLTEISGDQTKIEFINPQYKTK